MPKISQYNNRQKLEAIELSTQIGVSAAAEQLGIPVGTVAAWRHRRGLSNKHSKKYKIRAAILHRDGLSFSQIGRVLGVSKTTAYRWHHEFKHLT